MVSLLQLFKKNRPQREYRAPEGTRVYAVGDIHGRVDLLKVLHGKIAADSESVEKDRHIVVYLGDYVDRGPYVKEAVDEVMAGLPGTFEKVYLMGNHEQILLEFLEDPAVYDLWIGLGGQPTLLSYGVGVGVSVCRENRGEEARKALMEAMPAAHLAFFKNLRPWYQLGDYLFVHAGIRPRVGLEKQSEGDLFWIRDGFLDSETDHGVRVVHGHTVAEQVQDHSNRLGVDTGAYATGVLTCAVLEGGRVRYLSTG